MISLHLVPSVKIRQGTIKNEEGPDASQHYAGPEFRR